MDIAHSLHTEVSSISFSFFTSDDIRSVSVKKIDNPVLLDSLNLPNNGGLYDPKLGPMTPRDMFVILSGLTISTDTS
jgi:DNA-directed RNA polymerase I subunit RPA1